MKTIQIVFSPTGGTQKVADNIMKKWASPITKIDLTNATADYSEFNLEKEDIALIAIPSYGGRVPAPAAQRLAKIHGNGANLSLIHI